VDKNILKKQWFVVEEIPQNCYYMMGVAKCFSQDWPNWGLGNFIKHFMADFNKNDSRLIYIRKEFDQEADYLSKKMTNNPGWAIKKQKEIMGYASKSIKVCKKILKLNLGKYNHKNLIKIHDEIDYYRTKAHGIGGSITWHADADKERFSKYLMNYLDGHIKKNKINLSLAKTFSVLTTPIKSSLEEKEEIALLKLAREIKQSPKIKNQFIKKDVQGINETLKKSNKEIYRKIKSLYNNYCWLTYQYLGPIKQIEEDIESLKNIFTENANIEELLRKIEQRTKNVKRQQSKIFKKLKLDNQHKKLFEVARECVFIKGYRKSALFLSLYAVERLFKEMGKRLYLTVNQMRQLFPWEIKDALIKQKFTVNQLNERYKFGVLYLDKKETRVYTGTEAKNILKNLKLEKVRKQNAKELIGTCACPGSAKGVVKIINVPKEIPKMNKNDILVSISTNPNLVPAMKKAAAIITDAGGLTCHAAIVSRELNIPCIVGVKIATKVLKDGDLVEVDADGGVVKILKK